MHRLIVIATPVSSSVIIWFLFLVQDGHKGSKEIDGRVTQIEDGFVVEVHEK